MGNERGNGAHERLAGDVPVEPPGEVVHGHTLVGDITASLTVSETAPVCSVRHVLGQAIPPPLWLPASPHPGDAGRVRATAQDGGSTVMGC